MCVMSVFLSLRSVCACVNECVFECVCVRCVKMSVSVRVGVCVLFVSDIEVIVRGGVED